MCAEVDVTKELITGRSVIENLPFPSALVGAKLCWRIIHIRQGKWITYMTVDVSPGDVESLASQNRLENSGNIWLNIPLRYIL